MADCIKEVKKALKGRLSDEAIEEIVNDLQATKDLNLKDGASRAQTKVFQRKNEIKKDIENGSKQLKRDLYGNTIKLKNLLDRGYAADKAVGDPSLGVESAIVGVNTPIPGAQFSVDSLFNGLRGQYLGGLINDLEKQDLLLSFNKMDADLERAVTADLAARNGEIATFENLTITPEAKKIAEIMFKYQRLAFHRENKAGSFKKLKQGRPVRTTHDIRRMVQDGEEAWIKYMMGDENGSPVLNWQKTANGDFAAASNEAKEKFLKSSYDAITTGQRKEEAVQKKRNVEEQDRNDVSFAFKGPKNLAKSRSASAVFTFVDSQKWYDYDQKYGKASLKEAYLQDLENSLRATSIMDVLGTNPEAMVQKVTKRLIDDFRGKDEGNFKVRRLKRARVDDFKFTSMLAEVTGEINIGTHSSFARHVHAFTSIQTLAKLGASWLAAFTDPGYVASTRIYQGRSMIDAWHDAFKSFYDGVAKKDVREVSGYLGVGFDTQIGDITSRFNVSDDIPGRMSKMMNLFFKINLLGPWTEAGKRGVANMISNDLGNVANLKFAKLPEDLQRILRIYNIQDAEWEDVRKGVKEYEGKKYIFPGEIPNEKLRENVFALTTNEANYAVPTPTARERALLRGGYRPDTPVGAAIRIFTQFKSFGVVGLTKAGGRQMYGYGAATKREQLQRGLAANTGLVNLIAGLTVMGYFSMQAKELAKGREARPLNATSVIAAALQGGALGIYGDFLFGEANRFGGGTLQTLAGPGITTFSDTADLLLKSRDILVTGDGDARGDLIRLIKSNIPFANLFYTKQALDYMIWYQLQEAVNPGYLARMEARVRKENAADFWLPPSSVVATGGGFR